MSDINRLPTTELDESVESALHFDDDYEDQTTEQLRMYVTHDHLDDGQLFAEDFDVKGMEFGGAQADPKTVKPEDAILIIAENFHTLKTGVPDADSRHLWGLAKDCLKSEDSAAEYVSDLINTGDYPVTEQLDSVERMDYANFYAEREFEDELKAAMKYSSLKSILPEADPAYLWEIATEYSNSNDDVFNQFVLHLQKSGDYPRSNLAVVSPEQRAELRKLEMSKNAQEILNTIDSLYVEQQLNTDPTASYNAEGVGQLILKIMEDTKLHPSKSEEYYRKVTQEAIEDYSDNFNVEKFLQKFPQPVQYFENSAAPGGPKYRADLLKYLRTVFEPYVTDERIRQIQKQEVSFIKIHRRFFGHSVPLKTIEYKLTDECGRFINELTYIRFYEEILPAAAISASLTDEQNNSANGFYEDDALPCELCEVLTPLQKILRCTEAHVFCAECVRLWANERLGQGSVFVNCLQSCLGAMTDEALECVLPPGGLDRLIKRRQEQDIGAARIDGLQNCLWCDYSYIPGNEDMDLVCLSPNCGERWCRKCRQLAHSPAPCEDTPEEVKKRVFVEERMTNAKLRRCPKCHIPIVKEEGCDLVACKCGATLCYNCGKASPGYHTCPNPRRNEDIYAEGQRAKREAERLFPNVALNYDPTRLA